MSDPTEFWKIRNGLLQANFLDYQEALRTAPAAPSPTPAHRRWEKKFLRNPAACRRRQDRPPRTKALRAAACVLLALGLSCAALLTTVRRRGNGWPGGLFGRVVPTPRMISKAAFRRGKWQLGLLPICQRGMQRQNGST